MKKIIVLVLTLILLSSLLVSCKAPVFNFPYQYDLTPYITIDKDDYMNLEVTKVDTTVTDEQLNNAIYEKLEAAGTLADVTDRPAENGDSLNINFKGFVDGVAFEGGEATNYDIVLGAGGFIPGFEDAIVGHNSGEEFTIDVTFPEGYSDELGGKAAQFEIKINSIKESVLPELNNDFVKEHTDYETVEEFIAGVTEEVAKINFYEAENTQRSEMYAAIYNEVTILDYPEDEYNFYYDDFVSYYETNAMEYYGVDLKTFIVDIAGSTEEEFYQYADANAKQLVEQELILYSIAKNEDLISKLTKEDYDAFLLEISEINGIEVSAIEEEFSETEILNSFIMEVVFDHLLENATIVDPVEETEEAVVITPVTEEE